jgi:hypothetical protein
MTWRLSDELREGGSYARDRVPSLHPAHDGLLGLWPLPLPEGATR